MKTKQQAEEAGRTLLAKLKGKGWKINIWETSAWHCAAINSPLTVYYDEWTDKYDCLMADEVSEVHSGSLIWDKLTSKSYKDPNKAVEKAVAAARKAFDSVAVAVMKAEKIVDGGPVAKPVKEKPRGLTWIDYKDALGAYTDTQATRLIWGLSAILERMASEAYQNGKNSMGQHWYNVHPIVRLYVARLQQLCTGNPSVARAECKRRRDMLKEREKRLGY